MKPIHVKPSLYAHYFEALKEIALNYGYNLVLHGSMSRDLDLIAIPWQEELGNCNIMIEEFAEWLGGSILNQSEEEKHCFPHGRISYVINLNRGEFTNEDPQYYLDISVIPNTPDAEEDKNQLYPMRSDNPNGDWIEDFKHENGNYMNVCCGCGNKFMGYKYRRICKVCDENLSF